MRNLHPTLKITFWLLMISLMIMLFVNNCTGQSIYFGQRNSKAVNMGTATSNGEYTISTTFTAGDSAGLYVTKGLIFVEFVKNRIYFEYPNIVFTTQYDDHGIERDAVSKFELVGVVCWSTLFNGKPHSLVVRRSATKKEILIDNIIVGSDATPPQAAFTGVIWLGSDRIDYKLNGTIQNFSYSPTYISSPTTPMPQGTVDTLEYPAGYIPFSGDWSKVADPVTQYNLFPAANFHRNSTVEYNSLMTELKYMSGYDPSKYNDYNKIALTGKILSTQLALKFHCGFRVCSNLNAFYSDVSKRQFSFDLAVMDTAKYYPNIPKDFGSALSQTSAILPLMPMPLENITASTPLSELKPTRDIVFQQAMLFRDNLIERNIAIGKLRHTENREVMGWMGGGLTGTEIFNRNYNYMLDSARSLFPFLYTTGYDIYSMHFWNENGLKYPQVLDMTNNNRSTISIYTEYQKTWKTKTWGNIRGGDFRDASLAAELAAGNKLSTPYVSPGWNKNVEQNMQISNYSGMLGIYLVEGSAFFYPAFFTIGSSGVQDPKSYCFIPVIPSYVQACVSNPEYYDIIINGDMVTGTTGLPDDFNQWSGKVTIKTVARKKGTKYLIATTNQKENVYNYVGPRKVSIAPTIDGFNLPIFTRPQATIFYFDSSKPIVAGSNPKHLTTSVQRGWPGYWRNANTLVD